MKLYSGSLCLFSHACRFVLKEKDIECDVVYTTDKSVEETVAELNPYGETPTLADRDLVLYDGLVVSEYLDERFPHPPLMLLCDFVPLSSRYSWYLYTPGVTLCYYSCTHLYCSKGNLDCFL